MLWRVIKAISHSNLEWRQFSIKAKEKKSKQTKGYIRVNSLFSVNNRIKMFCSGAGLSYDEDNVSKFCVIRQGIIKHLFGCGLPALRMYPVDTSTYLTRLSDVFSRRVKTSFKGLWMVLGEDTLKTSWWNVFTQSLEIHLWNVYKIRLWDVYKDVFNTLIMHIVCL